MPEPIPWDELPTKIQIAVHDALESAITELATEVYDTAPPFDSQPPALRLAHHLARISAATIITKRLTSESREEAYEAGAVEGSPANYSDLAYAAGITREGARKRWPGAVPDAKPGRPRKQVTVLFTGGPAEWDGYTMQYPASTLEGELESIGAHLVVSGDQVPEDVPADARAHYAPADGGLRHIWEFKGWVPA